MGCSTTDWEGEKKLVGKEISTSETKNSATLNKKWSLYKQKGLYLKQVIEEPLDGPTKLSKGLQTEIPDITSVSGALEKTEGRLRHWKVVSTELNVRSGPGSRFPIIRKLKRGSKVTEVSKEGVWVQIGDQEFVSSRFLEGI